MMNIYRQINWYGYCDDVEDMYPYEILTNELISYHKDFLDVYEGMEFMLKLVNILENEICI